VQHQRSSLLPVLIFVCALTAARIAYLLWWCPYNLAEDEAQYWVWAKHLSWSYYSKGPGIAWAIAATTALYGDAEWAIRLVAAVSGGLAAGFIGGLARDMARAAAHVNPARVGLICAGCFALVPFFQMSSVLSTIDGPLIACWAGASWASWRAVCCQSRAAWLALGFAVAIGFLFKYTMLLIVPGVGLAAWFGERSAANSGSGGHGAVRSTTPWIVLAAVIALIGLLPVVVWNSQSDWVTFRHLLGHLGVEGGDMNVGPSGVGGRRWYQWLPVWPMGLALAQVGMVGPLLILGVVAACRSFRASVSDQARLRDARFLALLAAPIALFYLVVAYITEPEGNWPIAASVTFVPLAVMWRLGVWALPATTEAQQASPARRRRRERIVFGTGVLYGVLAIGPLHRADVAYSVVNRIMAIPSVSNLLARVRKDGLPPAPITPGRLIGSRDMGHEVAGLMSELRTQTGKPAFVIAQHYGAAAQMMYYVSWETGPDGQARREAFCAGPLTGGRRSHFDYMPETLLSRPDLLGRPAVILSNNRDDVRRVWEGLFERVVEYHSPGGSRRLIGEHKKDRVVYFGFGYKGLPGKR
jgi:4-amino-4-deoxy-L-arabinose transferase-like glycosyltransferase